MEKITPFLWFDTEAEEAANFYISVFKDGKINRIAYNNSASPGPEGTVMLVDFEVNKQRFLALNGGPQIHFTEAVSFAVNCETQDEIDYYWNSLTAGGQEVACGWLKDKYGLSWQIIPSGIPHLLTDPDPARRSNVMKAVMGMKKLVIADLQKAYEEA